MLFHFPNKSYTLMFNPLNNTHISLSNICTHLIFCVSFFMFFFLFWALHKVFTSASKCLIQATVLIETKCIWDLKKMKFVFFGQNVKYNIQIKSINQAISKEILIVLYHLLYWSAVNARISINRDTFCIENCNYFVFIQH